jgi:phosphoadenosine phosphosulfate reductase
MHELIREELVVSPWTTQELDRLNAHYRTRSPQELLTWAADHFGPQVVLTCSFSGASGMVLLDMVAKLDRELPVLFLDTDLLFPETYALAETAARRYGIAIQRRHPSITLEEQERQEGPELYATDPDRCCGIRKVAPLAEALRPYHAWISGIRRDQSATRARTNLLQWNERHHLLKISPLAFWTEREVWTYIHANEVPYNPLLDQGYPSIGCVPCTRPASPSSELRAGRWAGKGKTECGIHL